MNNNGQLISTMSESMRFADYGSMIVEPQTLALIRGTGNFNESPTYQQSINRGPTQSNSLQYYGSSDYYNNDKALEAENYYSTEREWKNIQSSIDQQNKRPYVVGSTGLHAEKQNSWDRPDFQYSRGTDQYQIWAANSMQLTPNMLMNLFFSEDNINYLQEKMISEVKRIRDLDISKQSVDELLIIMRNNYMYALYGWLPSSNNPELNKKPMARGTYLNPTYLNPNGKAYDSSNNGGCTSLYEQIKRLNTAVIQECVKQVLSGIDAYMKYYSDASSLPMPLSIPIYTSMKGSNVLQENLGFENGHEMSNAISSYNERYNII